MYLHDLIYLLLEVNIYWGILNLFPVLPLDGGQIAREWLIMANPSRGVHQSFMLSTTTAVVLAVVMLSQGSLFLTILFSLSGCFQLQRAVGCNSPGIFGCKDKPQSAPQGPEAYPELRRAPESGRPRATSDSQRNSTISASASQENQDD